MTTTTALTAFTCDTQHVNGPSLSPSLTLSYSLSSPILLPHHEFTEPENRDDDASDRDSREHRHHHIPGGEEEDAEGDGETYEKTVH